MAWFYLSIPILSHKKEEEEDDRFISISLYFPSTSTTHLEAVKGKRKIFRRKSVSVHVEGCGWPLAVKSKA